MAYSIIFSERFEKHYRKLSDTEKTQFKNKLKLFVDNQLHPSLRTKRIQGTADLFEFSVNMDIRVIWKYDGDTIILCLDIGHHNILNRF